MRPFQKWLLWSSSLLTGVTGALYWWMKDVLEPLEPWAVIHHPLQPWVLKAHILVAPVMVFAVGLVAAEHIWKHFRQRVRTGWWSGVTAMAVFVPMTLSGYLIQAVTDAAWLAVLGWTHTGAGGLYLVALVLHHPRLRAVRGRVAPARAAGTDAPRRPQVAAARARRA